MAAVSEVEDDLPPAMADRIQADLAAGERLVWAGRAHPPTSLGRRMLPISVGCFVPTACLVLLGVALLLSVSPFEALAKDEKDALTVGVFITGFLALAGCAVLIAAQLLEDARVRRTCYALTTRRAMVWRPAHGTSGLEVRSFWPSDLNATYRIDRGDGTGDLVFQEVVAAGGINQPAVRHGFLGIRSVRTVEELLRLTLLGPPTGPDRQQVFAP
jgi:hypothetical protein